MLLKKIKTNFFVIVDIATPIRMNDSYLDDVGSIRKCVIEDSRYWKERTQYKRINYSTSPLSNCKSISLQEVKELIGEVDVEKKVRNEMGIPDYLPTNSMSPSMQGPLEFGIKCYNQALENNKEKKYTEDDMLLFAAEIIGKLKLGIIKEVEDVKTIIQSLQPKTEWEVEIVDGKLKLV